MAYVKIGFHMGNAGNPTGIGNYMAALNSAGIPFSLKSVDNAGVIKDAVDMAGASGVKHNIIYRLTQPGGAPNDLPDFSLDPHPAAVKHWNLIKANIAPELKADDYRDFFFVEPTNEIDTKEHPGAEWTGWFCYHIAGLMIADGYKAALAGFNAGQPEKEHWKLPGFVEFLKLCAANPDRAAVSLHEGKLGDMNAHPSTFYPHLIGRFQWLFAACAEMGIARPTTFISEWAWAYNNMPGAGAAMSDVEWLAELVAKFTAVKGVFLWNLAGGEEWGGLPDKLQKLIVPITDFTLNTTFPDPEEPEEPPMDTWQEQAAKIADDTQALNYKAGASLQTTPTSHGFQVFGNEFDFVRPDGVKVRVRGAIHPTTAVRRYYWCPVPQWSNVSWFEVDGGTPTPPPFPVTIPQ